MSPRAQATEVANMGLLNGHYYWCRHTDGSHFVAKLNDNAWWVPGIGYAVEVTRDQVICHVPPPKN